MNIGMNIRKILKQEVVKGTLIVQCVEMFVRMLTIHCDQNNSYEITINGFQVRKNKRNLFHLFRLFF